MIWPKTKGVIDTYAFKNNRLNINQYFEHKFKGRFKVIY